MTYNRSSKFCNTFKNIIVQLYSKNKLSHQNIANIFPQTGISKASVARIIQEALSNNSNNMSLEELNILDLAYNEQLINILDQILNITQKYGQYIDKKFNNSEALMISLYLLNQYCKNKIIIDDIHKIFDELTENESCSLKNIKKYFTNY